MPGLTIFPANGHVGANNNAAKSEATAKAPADTAPSNDSAIGATDGTDPVQDIASGPPTVSDADPWVDEGQDPNDTAQPKPIAESVDFPGVVDEEPLDTDNDDDPDIHQEREVEVTEDFFADDFVARYGDGIRFNHTTGRWHDWNGFYWPKDETNRVFHMSRQFSRRLRAGDKRIASKKSIEGMEIMARRDPRVTVTADDWDPDPFVLGGRLTATLTSGQAN